MYMRFMCERVPPCTFEYFPFLISDTIGFVVYVGCHGLCWKCLARMSRSLVELGGWLVGEWFAGVSMCR